MKLFVCFALLLCQLLTASMGSVSVIGELARTTTIKPGDAFQRVILLRNNGKAPSEVNVSQNDYLFSADGSNEYGQPGTTARSNANWITVSPTRLKLAPGETLPVRYQGRAPLDLKLKGSFWSMIMVEPNTAPAITPDNQPEKIQVGLATSIRFAIQIVTEIGRSGTPSLQIQAKRLIKATDSSALQLDVGNDGERLLIPLISVELFNPAGASIGRFEAGRTRIYPGCSVRANVMLTNVPAGKYTAMVLLDSGEAQVLGAQYDLELMP